MQTHPDNRWIRRFTLLSRVATAVFFLSFASLFIPYSPQFSSTALYRRVAQLTVLLLLGSAAVVFSSLVVREIVDAHAGQWRFSLRSLLLLTTIVAIVLGLIVWIAKQK